MFLRRGGLGKDRKYLSPKQSISYLKGVCWYTWLWWQECKGGHRLKSKGRLGQDRMEPSFGSVKEKKQRGKVVPDREVSQLWLNLQSLRYSHGKRRGNCSSLTLYDQGSHTGSVGETSLLKMQRRSWKAVSSMAWLCGWRGRDGHGISTTEEPLLCELHPVPRDTRVDGKTSSDFVLNKEKGAEGRGNLERHEINCSTECRG